MGYLILEFRRSIIDCRVIYIKYNKEICMVLNLEGYFYYQNDDFVEFKCTELMEILFYDA